MRSNKQQVEQQGRGGGESSRSEASIIWRRLLLYLSAISAIPPFQLPQPSPGDSAGRRRRHRLPPSAMLVSSVAACSISRFGSVRFCSVRFGSLRSAPLLCTSEARVQNSEHERPRPRPRLLARSKMLCSANESSRRNRGRKYARAETRPRRLVSSRRSSTCCMPACLPACLCLPRRHQRLLLHAASCHPRREAPQASVIITTRPQPALLHPRQVLPLHPPRT